MTGRPPYGLFMPENLWSRLAIQDNGCWLFTGALVAGGYGSVWDRERKKYRIGSRAAWEITNGPIPDGLLVLHKCDNRACCNPDHLFLGTYQDNVDDMIQKGRRVKGGAKGEAHGSAKFTESEVLRMREMHANGQSISDIAKEFNAVYVTVSMIVGRRTWKHI